MLSIQLFTNREKPKEYKDNVKLKAHSVADPDSLEENPDPDPYGIFKFLIDKITIFVQNCNYFYF